MDFAIIRSLFLMLFLFRLFAVADESDCGWKQSKNAAEEDEDDGNDPSGAKAPVGEVSRIGGAKVGFGEAKQDACDDQEDASAEIRKAAEFGILGIDDRQSGSAKKSDKAHDEQDPADQCDRGKRQGLDLEAKNVAFAAEEDGKSFDAEIAVRISKRWGSHDEDKGHHNEHKRAESSEFEVFFHTFLLC